MTGLIDGQVQLVNGEYWDVSPFTLQQTMRLGRDSRVQAFVESVAEHAPQFLRLQQWIGSQNDMLRSEAIGGLCAAMEGHDECLLALTALATRRPVGEIKALSDVDQAVLILAMIVENQGFFGRRLASHLEATKPYRMSSSHSPATAYAEST